MSGREILFPHGVQGYSGGSREVYQKQNIERKNICEGRIIHTSFRLTGASARQEKK